MTLRRVALGLVIAAELVFLATVVAGGAMYPGYDHARQYISELGATGAVTGPAVSAWGFLPSGVLLTAFCLLSAWLGRGRPGAVFGLLLLAWYGFGLIGGAAFPCEFECVRDEPTPAQMLHDFIGGTGYVTGAAGVLLVGLAARSSRAAWLAPLGIACAVVAFAGFGGVASEFEFRGVSQRILEVAIGVFLLAFGHAQATGRFPEPARP